MKEAIITDIQRASVHDGPGIRTTVFFKGCNMRCDWCHNPETISKDIDIMLNPEKCIGCNLCHQGCYSGAKTVCGKFYTIEKLVKEIKQDIPYFGDLGGVTLSGGEVFLQDEYVFQLIKELKKEGIGVAVETNFYHDYEKLRKFIGIIDYWIIDIKIFSAKLHKTHTGVDNKKILENVKLLGKTNEKIIIRTPVIKNINDSEEELLSIANWIKDVKNLMYYELLPYHPLGLSKNIENSTFVLKKYEAPEKEFVETIANKIKNNFNIELRFAGKLM